MATLKVHMRSVIYNNFDCFREPLVVRFQNDPTRVVADFSIQYVDGFCKGLICQSIVALIDSLESCLQKMDGVKSFLKEPTII